MKNIKETIYSTSPKPNIYELATQIYRMSSGAIEGVLISKISEALSNSLQSNEDIMKKKFAITSSLIGRFQEMDFSNLINTFAEKLERYYHNL